MIVVINSDSMYVKADDTLDVDVRYWTKTKSGTVRVNIAQAGTAAMKTAFEAALVAELAAQQITTSSAELRRLSAL